MRTTKQHRIRLPAWSVERRAMLKIIPETLAETLPFLMNKNHQRTLTYRLAGQAIAERDKYCNTVKRVKRGNALNFVFTGPDAFPAFMETIAGCEEFNIDYEAFSEPLTADVRDDDVCEYQIYAPMLFKKRDDVDRFYDAYRNEDTASMNRQLLSGLRQAMKKAFIELGIFDAELEQCINVMMLSGQQTLTPITVSSGSSHGKMTGVKSVKVMMPLDVRGDLFVGSFASVGFGKVVKRGKRQ